MIRSPAFLADVPPRIKQPKPWKDRAYLEWVAQLPCVVTMSPSVQVHHLIHGPWEHRKDDRRVLPLRFDLHALLHDKDGDEAGFFAGHGISAPYTTAAMLRSVYEDGGDVARAIMVLMEARR